MRWLFNYLRQCRCPHSFELVAQTHIQDILLGTTSEVWVYRCPKCGYIQKKRIAP